MNSMRAKAAHSGSRSPTKRRTQLASRPGVRTPITAIFAKLVQGEQVVEVFEFEAADLALRGTMTMTTTLTDSGGGTDVVVVHEGIPDSVPADNETGTRMAPANLARLVEAEPFSS
jgi:uncharacterized protein YndB with AHSA1/START domain